MRGRWWASHMQTRSRYAVQSHLSSNDPQTHDAAFDRRDRLRILILLSIVSAVFFGGLAFLMWVASGSPGR